MTSRFMQRLLGTGARDPGCEACFEVLDQYVDAVLRGEDAATVFPDVAAHIDNCEACREDTEGLIAVLSNLPASER